ncbi:hypothetical protein ACP8HZ_11005 [Francisella noatunensis]
MKASLLIMMKLTEKLKDIADLIVTDNGDIAIKKVMIVFSYC